MTQDDLAQAMRALDPERLAHTNEKSVSLYENGAPRVPFYVVDAIAEATGRPLSFFSAFTPRHEGAALDPRTVEGVHALRDAAEALLRRLGVGVV